MEVAGAGTGGAAGGVADADRDVLEDSPELDLQILLLLLEHRRRVLDQRRRSGTRRRLRREGETSHLRRRSQLQVSVFGPSGRHLGSKP